MENGASAEIAVVGNEGIVGIALFMGGESTPSRAVVQSAGSGFRLNSQTMKDEFNRAGPVLHLLLRYTQALITQMAQTAVCNRHHSLDQQLCRWLLLSLDRLRSNDLRMTQELIANMLGVRREGITEAALKLQKVGLIRYARGHITVLDRGGLEQRTCECYAVVKNEYDRLLPATLATLAGRIRSLASIILKCANAQTLPLLFRNLVSAERRLAARDQQPAQCVSGERKYAPQPAVPYEMDTTAANSAQALA